MKEDNVIDFYVLANKLKYKIRSGWKEIEIESDRLESVAEHIYGCLILAIGINSEYNLNLDMYKVFKMLTLHELEEILMPDYTIRSNISEEEKREKGRKCVHIVLGRLIDKKEIEALLNEFNYKKSKEAIFCYYVDKFECDLQAKIYDLEGKMDVNKAKEDVKYYGSLAKYVENNSSKASDYWLLYDKYKFKDDAVFSKLMDNLIKKKEL